MIKRYTITKTLQRLCIKRYAQLGLLEPRKEIYELLTPSKGIYVGYDYVFEKQLFIQHLTFKRALLDRYIANGHIPIHYHSNYTKHSVK